MAEEEQAAQDSNPSSGLVGINGDASPTDDANNADTLEHGLDGSYDTIGHQPQPQNTEPGLDGTPNIYRGSTTPPNNTHVSNGDASEQQSVTDQDRPSTAQGIADQDRAPSVSQAQAHAHARPSSTASHDVAQGQRPASSSSAVKTLGPAGAKARLPQDRIGLLEDRLAEDPRGDTEAWSDLIEEYKRRNKLPEARKVYDRFFQVFPSAANYWDTFANMELDNNNFYETEQVFQKALVDLPSVSVWTTYLNYVRRRNNLNNDPDGKNRKIVSEAFEFVLKQVGRDKDSGPLWLEYLQFLRSMPGNATGTGWSDQQKKDLLRAGYEKAICVPHSNVGAMWSEYTKFEISVDRAKAQSILQRVSPNFVQAKGARQVLENITRDLNPSTLAKLPPAFGFQGDAEYARQVEIWKQWIEWEKSDPLVLKSEQPDEYKTRILYVYKQALMALRFWPEMWFSAAEFSFANGLDTEGDKFLANGTTANPESCLLAFQRADRIESTTASEGNSPDSLKRRGEAVRKPYDNTINALYRLIKQTQERQERDVTRLEESHAQYTQQTGSPVPPKGQDDDDEEEDQRRKVNAASQAQLAAQVEAIKRGHTVQTEVLKKTLSFAWIALMRAMRRVQGQGNPREDEPVRGLRGVFADARKRGKLTSDVYIASALIEHHCFQDRVATKVFERGFKLFPNDVDFALAYIKHLFEIQDMTNARAVFKTMVGKLEKDPQNVPKTKPLYAFWHEYESRYGELNLVKDLEQHMSELFPEDPKLALFSSRYSSPSFDPCAIRPVVSPAAQTRPKAMTMTDEAALPPVSVNSPRAMTSIIGATGPALMQSPKRALDESDTESLPPRKMIRSDSPLKGAAGRRLDAAKRSHLRNDSNSGMELARAPAPAPAPTPATAAPTLQSLPPSLYNFLQALPPANAAWAQLRQVPPTASVVEAIQRADLQGQFNHERLTTALTHGFNPMQQLMGPPAPQMGGWQQQPMPGPSPAPPQQQNYGYGQPPQYMYR